MSLIRSVLVFSMLISLKYLSRIFYRHDRDRVYVLYVMRGERKLRKAALSERDPRK